jgi:hypothetical protein
MKTSSKRTLLVILLIMLIVALCSTSRAQEPTNALDSVILTPGALELLTNPYMDYFTKDDYKKVLTGYEEKIVIDNGQHVKRWELIRLFPYKATRRTWSLELTKGKDGTLVITRIAEPPVTKTYVWSSIWIGLFFLAIVIFILFYSIYGLLDQEEKDMEWFIDWDEYDDEGALNLILSSVLAATPVLVMLYRNIPADIGFGDIAGFALITVIIAILAGVVGYALHPYIGLLFRCVGELLALIIKAIVWTAMKAYFWILKPILMLALHPPQEKTDITWLEACKGFLRKNHGTWVLGSIIAWCALTIPIAVFGEGLFRIIAFGITTIALGITIFRYLEGKSFFMEKKECREDEKAKPATSENDKSNNMSNQQ